ncbi:hypothetical protein [Paracoccus sp. N5]|uniref:hypothetical protein n=1 Tax=Paracoccus sp. N5 TaxID=1101189 RepID=UPI0018DEDECF|nr:hypothetical protein [Paracoccus sp. N5]
MPISLNGTVVEPPDLLLQHRAATQPRITAAPGDCTARADRRERPKGSGDRMKDPRQGRSTPRTSPPGARSGNQLPKTRRSLRKSQKLLRNGST